MQLTWARGRIAADRELEGERERERAEDADCIAPDGFTSTMRQGDVEGQTPEAALMDIDWTKIRETVKRIERELSKADERASRADADVVRDWPRVSREDLEAAFPDWRRDFGPDWSRDFLKKRIGRENYRFCRGTREYRIAPDVFRGLALRTGEGETPGSPADAGPRNP